MHDQGVAEIPDLRLLNLEHPAFSEAPLTVQLSQNLARRVGLAEGGRLSVWLPPERVRVFDAEVTRG